MAPPSLFFNKNPFLPPPDHDDRLQMAPPESPATSSPDSLVLVDRLPSGVAVVTINRPGSLNSLTRPMMVDLARIFKTLDGDPAVGAVVIVGRGRAFCSGVDLTEAEEVFKGEVKDEETDLVIQMERCRKPIIGAVAGFAVTAGFEIALACDLIVAGRDAKFIDTHCRFGIFPSWGLSQKLSRVIGPNRAREVSLACMPITADMAEKWGLVNHVVDNSDVLKKAIGVAESILKNNRDMVLKCKSVINDGLKLNLSSALQLEKERAHKHYEAMPKEQFAQLQKFISTRSAKPAAKL